MLRITRISEQHSVILKLEGKLAGPWVDELEKAWHSTEQIADDQPLIVDLNGVTLIDLAGAKLIRRMHTAGTSFSAEGTYISHELRRITSGKPLS